METFLLFSIYPCRGVLSIFFPQIPQRQHFPHSNTHTPPPFPKLSDVESPEDVTGEKVNPCVTLSPGPEEHPAGPASFTAVFCPSAGCGGRALPVSEGDSSHSLARPPHCPERPRFLPQPFQQSHCCPVAIERFFLLNKSAFLSIQYCVCLAFCLVFSAQWRHHEV